MKKVLFATTALVATAGVAAADITFSGYGRFGLQYEDDRLLGDDAQIDSRLRINIDGSTESDGGIAFGARFRMQADENKANNSAFAGSINGARFHVEYGGLRGEVGNIAGAFDDLPNYYGYEPGLIGAVGQYANFGGPIIGYSSTGTGVNGIKAKYSMGDFSVIGAYNNSDEADLRPERYEVSAAYTFSDWTLAGAYGNSDGALDDSRDYYVVTIGGSFSMFDITAFYGNDDITDDAFGVSGSVDFGAATSFSASYSTGDTGADSYGVGINHSLGGGVNILGMVGRNTASNTVADLGVKFNF